MEVSAKPQKLAFLQSYQILKVPILILLWIVGGLSGFTLLSYTHYTAVQTTFHSPPSSQGSPTLLSPILEQNMEKNRHECWNFHTFPHSYSLSKGNHRSSNPLATYGQD